MYQVNLQFDYGDHEKKVLEREICTLKTDLDLLMPDSWIAHNYTTQQQQLNHMNEMFNICLEKRLIAYKEMALKDGSYAIKQARRAGKKVIRQQTY